MDRNAILFNPNAMREFTRSGKVLAIVAATALLVSIGAASAKEPVKLTNGQVNKVSPGAINNQIPLNTAAFANGASGRGGVNQFSPSTATVTQTNTATAFNLFTVH